MAFKENFLWGAATSAYQLEGGFLEDGRGLSVWDVFSHTPGKIYDNHNGDVSCDHYHRLEDDLELMKELGLKSYRFSVSWSRIIPDGIGKVNEKGIDFYNRLIDGLIKHDIKPCLTLYHWDLPYSLHLKGGWLSDEAPQWFEYYTKIICESFGDRVKDFITFNEPQVFGGCGYFEGVHAPGYKLGKGELLRIGHNILKAHGRSVTVLRKVSDVRIGFTAASCPCIPASKESRDIEAARESYFASDYDAFLFSDAYWLDAIIKGRYPEWVYNYKGFDAPTITEEEMKLISQPIDFLGMNIYNGKYVSAESGILKNEDGIARTSIGWPITPEALYWGPKFYFERYEKPIMITENGMACHDAVSMDGKVHDPNRTDYLNRYIAELKRAAEDGVEVDGYYVWSLIDNFEWAQGYKERFGVIYCDYKTGKRIIKDSGVWYSKVIESNGEIL